VTDTAKPQTKSRRLFLADLGIAAAAVALSGVLGGCNSSQDSRTAAQRRLNFYNWDTYIGKTTLSDFTAATGISVNMSLFANNDELFAKLRAGNPGFDVIVPSNDFVERMTQAGMLLPLDHAKIPNFSNVFPEYQNPQFDPERKYSMPYTWIVQGIGYRKSKVAGIPDSWKCVFDSPQYAGRIAVFSEARSLRLVQKYLGRSLNDPDPMLIAQVEQLMIAQKPNIKAFHDDNGQDLLLAGEVDIVVEYNGDIAQVMQEDPDLDFVVPREGSQISSDCLAIPAGAPHPESAHAFINYLLDGKAGADIARTIKYPTPNRAAKELMPDSYKSNPVIFPSEAAMKHCEYVKYLGPAVQRRYEDAMTRIRAA
jgi:spermidine/putrescine transport system substrate-binding protein